MKRAVTAVVLGWLLLTTLAVGAAEAGLRLNASPSVPRGVYWLTSKAPAVGAYVAVCPPPSPLFAQARARGYLSAGRCPGDYSELLKVLAAGPGATVRVERGGVRIDGRLWPSSAPLRRDPAGWALPQLAGVETQLGPSAVLVMSQRCVLGFDSRYFGPLPRSAITATAAPLLTW